MAFPRLCRDPAAADRLVRAAVPPSRPPRRPRPSHRASKSAKRRIVTSVEEPPTSRWEAVQPHAARDRRRLAARAVACPRVEVIFAPLPGLNAGDAPSPQGTARRGDAHHGGWRWWCFAGLHLSRQWWSSSCSAARLRCTGGGTDGPADPERVKSTPPEPRGWAEVGSVMGAGARGSRECRGRDVWISTACPVPAALAGMQR
jgi:hypothetical protein